MPSDHDIVTVSPTPLSGLETGSSYTIQNCSPLLIFFAEADSAPARDYLSRHILAPFPETLSVANITKEQGSDWYAWCSTDTALLVSTMTG